MEKAAVTPNFPSISRAVEIQLRPDEQITKRQANVGMRSGVEYETWRYEL